MRIDEHNVLIIEKDGPPGDLGDSCAETGRFVVLSNYVVGRFEATTLNLDAFIGRNGGFVRHPDVPEDWKEKDFTSDQGINLLMAYYVMSMGIGGGFNYCASNMKWFTAKYNKISSPGVMALARKKLHILNWINALQGLVFRLPLRWSDAKGWFDKSHDSSADYLNWIVVAAFLDSVGVKPILNVDRRELESKILSYYSNQQNTKLVTDLYMAATEMLYDRV